MATNARIHVATHREFNQSLATYIPLLLHAYYNIILLLCMYMVSCMAGLRNKHEGTVSDKFISSTLIIWSRVPPPNIQQGMIL